MSEHPLRNLALQWILGLAALLVVGPVAGWLAASVPAADGGPHATMLVNASLVRGVVSTGLGLALAAGVGVLGARLVGVGPALVSAGITLAWLTWRGGEVQGLFRATGSPGVLWTLAAEGVLLALAGAAMVLLIERLQPSDEGRRSGDRDDPRQDRPASAEVGKALAISFVAAGVVGWLIAQEGLKGQTLGACAVAGVAAGFAGRLSAPSVPVSVPAIGCLLWAPIAPLLGGALEGADAIAHSYANSLFHLAWIVPSDWLAGSFIGLPVGLTWAASSIASREAKAARPA